MENSQKMKQLAKNNKPHKEIFNFLSRQENANQNYFEVSSYTSNSQDE